MKINLDSSILDEGMGGISVGTNVKALVNYLEENHIYYDTVEISELFTEYKIFNGILFCIINNQNQQVHSISCMLGYSGKYNHTVGPHMSLKEIIAAKCERLTIIHGFLMLNEGLTVGFSLPNEIEDYDYVHELPQDIILEKFYVMRANWWR